MRGRVTITNRSSLEDAPGKSRHIDNAPQKVEPPQPRTNSRRTIVLLCCQSFYLCHQTDTGQSPTKPAATNFAVARIFFFLSPEMSLSETPVPVLDSKLKSRPDACSIANTLALLAERSRVKCPLPDIELASTAKKAQLKVSMPWSLQWMQWTGSSPEKILSDIANLPAKRQILSSDQGL